FHQVTQARRVRDRRRGRRGAGVRRHLRVDQRHVQDVRRGQGQGAANRVQNERPDRGGREAEAGEGTRLTSPAAGHYPLQVQRSKLKIESVFLKLDVELCPLD